MKKSTVSVQNARLGLTLVFHVMHPHYTFDSANNTIIGQVHSYKSKDIEDLISPSSIAVQASLVSPMIIEGYDGTQNLKEFVENYFSNNIDKIVSR